MVSEIRSNYLIRLFCLILMFGCSSKPVKYFNNNSTKPMHFYVPVIKDLSTMSFKDFWYSTNPSESCFENSKPTDNIVTTTPAHSEKVFKMVFYNHSAINLKRVQGSGRDNQFVMEAYEEMQIKYDIAYCYRVFTGGLFDSELEVVSYRITSIDKPKNEHN